MMFRRIRIHKTKLKKQEKKKTKKKKRREFGGFSSCNLPSSMAMRSNPKCGKRSYLFCSSFHIHVNMFQALYKSQGSCFCILKRFKKNSLPCATFASFMELMMTYDFGKLMNTHRKTNMELVNHPFQEGNTSSTTFIFGFHIVSHVSFQINCIL